MPFGHLERLKPKLEHVEKVLSILMDGGLHSPKRMSEATMLSLNQVTCSLNYLEARNVIRCIEQKVSPVKQAQLIEGSDFESAKIGLKQSTTSKAVKFERLSIRRHDRALRKTEKTEATGDT